MLGRIQFSSTLKWNLATRALRANIAETTPLVGINEQGETRKERERECHGVGIFVADAKRRTFTAEYKQRVLAEADAVTNPGAIGALLRREGLYSSHLVTWRRERQAGIVKGLTPRTRGPKVTRTPQDEELRQLRKANQRLTENLRKATIVIDVQKKVAALLEGPRPTSEPEEPR